MSAATNSVEVQDLGSIQSKLVDIQVPNIVKEAVSSIVGATACVYTGQPFDTLKVRMQVKVGSMESAWHCMKRTISEEGILALWKGCVPATVGAVAENVVAFSTNGLLKKMFHDPSLDHTQSDKINVKEPILTGAATGIITAHVLCPCDIVKCRSQIAISHGHGVLPSSQIIASIIRTKGLRGMYTGIGAQVMREIPFFSAFFGSYEILCQSFRKYTKMNDTTIYFVSGGLAGQIAWVASIWADAIKSVIQTSDTHRTIRGVAQEIYASKGFRGFFAGTGVAVLRAFPANAALFVGYEYSKAFLSKL